MLKKFNVTNYERVQLIQSEDQPQLLIIAQADEYNWSYKEEIGSFDFSTMEGYLQLLNGTRKEYKRFNSLLNNFFAYDEYFSWNSKVVDNCKAAGKVKKINDKKEAEQQEKIEQLEKVEEYLSKLNNNDPAIIETIEKYLITMNDEEIIKTINNTFKNVITENKVMEIFATIKNKMEEISNQPEQQEPEVIEDNKIYMINNQTFSTWLQAFEYCKENELDYLYIEEMEPTENNETIENNQITVESYQVGNRNFTTYENAYNYCLSCDFDPETMIIKEVASIEPLNPTIKPETTEQPELFHLYNNTFTTYSEAYNYCIVNEYPVTMILSSLHITMNNERLQELELQYKFSKHNMSITDMKEYFDYIMIQPVSTDQEDRYYKLKGWIKRYENKQRNIELKKQHEKEMAIQINNMISKLYSIGMIKKEYEHSTVTFYYLDNELIYNWTSGISTETMYNELVEVYNRHYIQPKAV